MKYLDMILKLNQGILYDAFRHNFTTTPYDLRFVHIDESAEGYLDMNTKDHSFKVVMTLDLFKNTIVSGVNLLDAIILINENTKNEELLIRDRMIKEASLMLKCMLRVWNDEYTEDDLDMMGSMPDPFALTSKLRPLLKMYNKIYSHGYVTTDECNKLNRIVKQIAVFYEPYDESLNNFHF